MSSEFMAPVTLANSGVWGGSMMPGVVPFAVDADQDGSRDCSPEIAEKLSCLLGNDNSQLVLGEPSILKNKPTPKRSTKKRKHSDKTNTRPGQNRFNGLNSDVDASAASFKRLQNNCDLVSVYPGFDWSGGNVTSDLPQAPCWGNDADNLATFADIACSMSKEQDTGQQTHCTSKTTAITTGNLTLVLPKYFSSNNIFIFFC